MNTVIFVSIVADLLLFQVNAQDDGPCTCGEFFGNFCGYQKTDIQGFGPPLKGGCLKTGVYRCIGVDLEATRKGICINGCNPGQCNPNGNAFCIGILSNLFRTQDGCACKCGVFVGQFCGDQTNDIGGMGPPLIGECNKAAVYHCIGPGTYAEKKTVCKEGCNSADNGNAFCYDSGPCTCGLFSGSFCGFQKTDIQEFGPPLRGDCLKTAVYQCMAEGLEAERKVICSNGCDPGQCSSNGNSFCIGVRIKLFDAKNVIGCACTCGVFFGEFCGYQTNDIQGLGPPLRGTCLKAAVYQCMGEGLVAEPKGICMNGCNPGDNGNAFCIGVRSKSYH